MNQSASNSQPNSPEPYWRESVTFPEYPEILQDYSADVTIVGGGISGLTAAYILSKKGKNVVVLEADRILNGTTGHTTAKITAQHGLIYDELIQHFGKNQAKKYYNAQMDARDFIKQTIQEENIDCDFSDEDAYVYSTTDKYKEKIEKEMEAYEQLGIPGSLTNEIPFNIPIKNAIIMHGQSQYHPLKYFRKIVDKITEQGAEIFENSPAVDIHEDRDSAFVVLKNGKRVKSSKVLICTHFPFYDKIGFYFARMNASRSYILGVKAEQEFPGGMYINAENPSRSLRSTKVDGEDLILIGGENHKTGHDEDTKAHYQALESFGKEVFGEIKVPYKWSAQDLETLDKIPYIGHLTENQPNVYLATGYKKWGMTSGALAGKLLSDLVLGNENPYTNLFSPSRFVVDPSLRHLLKQNLHVAKRFITGKIEKPLKTPEDLKKGEGDLVQVNEKKCGAYRDEKGILHLVDTTCTHMGCEVEWNNGEHTWDCPCHGSRFNIDGEVIEGPAKKGLNRIQP